MPGAPDGPLPMTVIGGFLGAGKTTLLNRWLRDAGGWRMAVLVNDFGAINIDADAIAARRGDTIALSNGCVCCQIGDDLSLALMGILERRAHFDAIVVEASGVSDPWRIAQFARADPELSPDGVVVLVDASAVRAQGRDPLLADTLQRQLRSADIVIVNKIDLVDSAELAAVRAWIDQVAGSAACFETARGEVPAAVLTRLAMPGGQWQGRRASGTVEGVRDQDQRHDHEHDDPLHGNVFDTWSARPARPFDAESLRAWLRAPPPGLLRLKGHVQGLDRRWLSLQFAGRHGAVRSADTAPRQGAAIVAIGLRGRLPIAALERAFGTRTGE